MSHFTTVAVGYNNPDAIVAALKSCFAEYGYNDEIEVERYERGKGGKLNPYDGAAHQTQAQTPCEIILRRQQVDGMRYNDIGFAWNDDRQAYDMFCDDHDASMPFPRSELPRRFSAHYVAAVCESKGLSVNRDDILKGRVVATKPQTSKRRVYA